MLEIVVTPLLVISGMLAVLGGIGLFRFPDFYTRTHAATIISIGSTTLALFALMISTFWSILTAKILLIIIINVLANPTTTHVIAEMAYRMGIKPQKLAKNEIVLKGKYK